MLNNHGWEKQQTQRPKKSGPKRVRQAKKPTKSNPAMGQKDHFKKNLQEFDKLYHFINILFRLKLDNLLLTNNQMQKQFIDMVSTFGAEGHRFMSKNRISFTVNCY